MKNSFSMRTALIKLIEDNAGKILRVADMYEEFPNYYNLSEYQLEDDPKYRQARYKHEIRSELAKLVKAGIVVKLEGRDQYTSKRALQASQKLTVSDSLYLRLVEFKKVVDELLKEDSPEFEVFVEGIIDEGLDEMLRRLIRSDPETLQKSLVQLAERYPQQVCEYIAHVLARGEEAEREEARRHMLGFVRYLPAEKQ
jgi:hypothetical protein